MRPEFSAAIDPIFEATIHLMQQLESGIACSASEHHAWLLSLFERAETMLGRSQQWELSRYAIAVWIDEMLLSIPWDGADWWRNHILEMELFQTRICNVRFFELAREASGLQCRDALEVFYNCVVLGFRGMYSEYRLDENFAKQGGWPLSIDQWLSRNLARLDVSLFEDQDVSPMRVIRGAAPLFGRSQLVWWSVAVLVLVLANCTVYQFLHAGR